MVRYIRREAEAHQHQDQIWEKGRMEDRPSFATIPSTVNPVSPVRGRRLFRHCHGRSRGAIPFLFLTLLKIYERKRGEKCCRLLTWQYVDGKDHEEEMHKASIIEKKGRERR